MLGLGTPGSLEERTALTGPLSPARDSRGQSFPFWAGLCKPCALRCSHSSPHWPPRENLALYGQKSQCQLLLLLPCATWRGVLGLLGRAVFLHPPSRPLLSPGALETITALAR